MNLIYIFSTYNTNINLNYLHHLLTTFEPSQFPTRKFHRSSFSHSHDKTTKL
jgi:hypothetical protein